MKKLYLLCLIIIFTLAFSGCGLVERLQAWKSGEEIPEPEPAQEEIVQNLPPEEQENSSQDSLEKQEIVLYFADESNSFLKPEKRQIPKTEGIARATIGELINGPKAPGLLPVIPSATILEDINIKDGICIVDFSAELKDNHPGGAANEELTVYAIVNTLTQFKGVEEVRILVDGKIISTLAGHVDVSETMARNNEIIR